MLEGWKDMLSKAGWEQTHLRPAGEAADGVPSTPLARYSELRAAGLDALAAGDIDLALRNCRWRRRFARAWPKRMQT